MRGCPDPPTPFVHRLHLHGFVFKTSMRRGPCPFCHPHSFRAVENPGSVLPGSLIGQSFRPLLLHEELGVDGIRYRPTLHSTKGIGELRVLRCGALKSEAGRRPPPDKRAMAAGSPPSVSVWPKGQRLVLSGQIRPSPNASSSPKHGLG